jgi:hypothetical protein
MAENMKNMVLDETQTILSINLDTDTYEIITRGDREAAAGYGMSERASEWFRNYALRGYVQESDLEQYLLFTELHALRGMCRQDREKKLLKFRRRVNQEFRWAVMEILPGEDSAEGQPQAVVTIRDLGEEDA